MSPSISPEEVRARLASVSPALDLRAMLGPEARDAVVMVPLSFGDDLAPSVHVLVRAQGLRDHAGEVSFPGGKVEAGEERERAVAREVEEEVGLHAEDFELLGSLLPVPVVTGRFLIHPFVARVLRAPRITSSEHAHLYEVPLRRWLVDGERIEVTEAPWRGLPLSMPHFRIGEHVMYGASALILFDLLSRLTTSALATVRVEDKPWGNRYAADEEKGK